LSLTLVDQPDFQNSSHPSAELSIELFAIRLANELLVDMKAKSREAVFRRELILSARDIRGAYTIAVDILRRNESISAQSEWLIDNYYIVEDQIADIEDLLPIGFLRKLPRTAAGYPRIGELTRQILAYCDSELDEPTIHRFIDSFQSVAPLTIAESWAFPILLRVSLIENLRMIAIQMTTALECQREAEQRLAIWQSQRIFDFGEESTLRSMSTIVKMLELLGSPDVLPGSDLEENSNNSEGDQASNSNISAIVFGADPTSEGTLPNDRVVDDSRLALIALRQHVKSLGWDLAEVAREERQRQAAGQVRIGNIITSMRFVSGMNWLDFFERVNYAEAVLKRDPHGIYTEMDFASRNEYRTVVESVAKQSRKSDIAVAEVAINMATAYVEETVPELRVRSHVGYWLVGDGFADLMDELAIHSTPPQRLLEQMRRRPHGVYFGGLMLFTFLIVVAIVAFTSTYSIGWVSAGLIMLLAVLPASEMAMLLHGTLITRFFKPKKLPKLAFRNGVPDKFPTIVVVPSMLSSRKEAKSLLEKLEVHYLNNPDPSLSFALLTDFTDAPQPTMPDDEDKLQEAIEGIRRLNAKYASNSAGPFFLFHRARQWNPSEGAWMGWERKRGKLMEFGKLLRAEKSTSYVVQEGDQDRLATFQDSSLHPFVVTLDADTQLPRDSAKKMIGTLAHPLNRPHMGRGNIVRTGYSILQPRVSIHLADVTKTRYVRVMASSAGLDPYVTAASDVYQDLFGEGSFTGKGIYDLHAFERTVDDAFPENTILSHDLIEGCHARVAVVSDIEVFDGYPLRYDADAKRMHRWVRGDWQISPWLFPIVPYVSGTKPNPLSILSRWKIFDNLRRSLVAPATLALLLFAWFASPSHAYEWAIVAMTVAFFPATLAILVGLCDWFLGYRQQRKPFAVLAHLSAQWWFTVEQCLYSIMLLPHKTVQMVDAIIRSNYRIWVSNTKLLEWETAQAAESRLSQKRWAIYQQLWYLPMLGLAVLVLLPSSSRLYALPWLLAWFFAPWITDRISRVKVSKKTENSETQRNELRAMLSATWAFLEQFVDQTGNWLPPDNVQEYPSEKVATRISPTNEGLFLVSALIARDFGLIGLERMIELLEKNVNAWKGLVRYRGHWLNWYDTAHLSTLPPRYVSTVDSGNLAVSLMTFRTGLDEYSDRPIWGSFLKTGVLDSVAWLLSQIERLDRQITSTSDPLSTVSQSISRILTQISDGLPANPNEPIGWLMHRERTITAIVELRQCQANALAIDQRNLARKVHLFCERLTGLFDDIQSVVGWLREDSIPEFVRTSYSQSMSLRGIQRLNSSHRECLKAIPGFSASTTYIDQLMARMKLLSDWSEESLEQMDFRFLYNSHRKLFSIGYNLETQELDRSHYDLLCSESRLASYFAIAKGDVESNHWFQLGRKSTIASGKYSLISWGGTMFEYLMPPLFQKSYDLSLITESCRAAVHHQQQYAKSRGVPWGISESGFASMAKNSDYHYQSFGVPGLGLKRGLAKDLVISPYSTLMAVPIDPVAAFENLRWLRAEQGEGDWGFYEAIDFTPSRLRRNQKCAVVRSYMAHHQGMAILALANYLDSGSTQRRFSMHPLAKSSELLLQEKLPSASHVTPVNPDEAEAPPIAMPDEGLVSRRILGVDSKAPRINLLSNNLPGSHSSVLTTQSGGGYIRWQDIQITRWEPDTTLDNAGYFIYLKDVQSGQFWSATFQPTLVTPDAYETTFSIDKTEYRRDQGAIETLLEVTVSPESAATIRQLHITNHDSVSRHLDVTTYCELLMAQSRFARFDKEFWARTVKTGYHQESHSLYTIREPFESHPNPLCVSQTITAPPKVMATISWETDRAKFLGEARTATQPVAMDLDRLAGTSEPTHDPIHAMRCRVELPPGESVTLAWTTIVTRSVGEAIAAAASYQTQRGLQRAFELSWALVPVELRHQSLTARDVHLFQRFASAILYPDRAYRYVSHRQSQDSDQYVEEEDSLRTEEPSMGQSDLWPWSISGDWPIVMIEVSSTEQLEAVKEMLRAHRFLASRGLRHDVILLNSTPGSYYDGLHDQIIGTLRDIQSTIDSAHDSVFLLRSGELTPRQINFLRHVATVFVPHNGGSLAGYMGRCQSMMTATVGVASTLHKRFALQRSFQDERTINLDVVNKVVVGDVEQEKGLRISYDALHHDLFGNQEFGFVTSPLGAMSTWQGDTWFNRVTAPVNLASTERTAERIYLSEVVDGERIVWTLPGFAKVESTRTLVSSLTANHKTQSFELLQEVQVSVDDREPIKTIDLILTNQSERARRITITYAVEWALDVDRIESQLHMETRIDKQSGALIACNPYHPNRPQQVAFLQVLASERSLTGSRKGFLGRNGTWQTPVALLEDLLDNQVGRGFDPVGAIQTKVTIEPGQTVSTRFLLGLGEDLTDAIRLVCKYAQA